MISKLPKLKESTPYILLSLIIAGYIFLVSRFFEYFPNGWDQTESVWAIKDNYLPHSPYILYFFLGKGISLLIPNPSIALSFISFVFGFFALIQFYSIQRSFDCNTDFARNKLFDVRFFSLLAVLFLSTNYLFIRQSSTQEPYTVQVFFIFFSIWLLQNPSMIRVLFSGITFGCAISVHYGSLFVLPALLYLIIHINKQINKRFTLLLWCTSVLIVLTLFISVIFLILPEIPGRAPLVNTLLYARGLGPGVSIQNLTNPTYLLESSSNLLERLFSQEIPQIRRPPPSFPIGITSLNALIAVIGGIFLWRRSRETTIFWLLFCIPYLIYEILTGQTPDFGAYLVFFLPAFASFEASAVVSLIEISLSDLRIKKWIVTGAVILSLLVISPSIVLFTKYWRDLEKDIVEHYSYWILTEIAAAPLLPSNAIVIQPNEDWNVNHLPYYTSRRHIARNGELLYIFNDWGPFTPLNPSSFELLTTEKLSDLLANGIPVYSFEEEPLVRTQLNILNKDCFEWNPIFTIELSEIHHQINIPAELRSRLPYGDADIYLGQEIICATNSNGYN